LVKCPKCNEEVEYFYKLKKYDAYLRCPKCNERFTKSDLPDGIKYKVKYLTETSKENEDKDKVESIERTEVTREERAKKTTPPLFEPPKEPTEIIAEILLDWGCDEDFVRRITEYIRTKGVFDPGWLMSMLTSARTGRRFTHQEAFMVVDMITSALEQEKRKAEEAGRIFPIGIITLKPSTTTTYVSHPQLLYQSTPYTQPIMTPYTVPTAPPPSPTQATPPQPHTQLTMPAMTQITPQQVQEWIRQGLEEFKKTSAIDELKRLVYEIEKKRIEDKAEFEKRIAEKERELEDRLSKKLDNTLKEIKEAISNITTIQQPQVAQPSIDKKDIEVLITKLQSDYEKKLSEIEKKHIEELRKLREEQLQSEIKKLEAKIEEIRKEAVKIPVSPEGWQKDETRLIAELGTRALDILKERRPIEYLVRIIPHREEKTEKTEKSLVDLIKESGGIVE